MAKQAFLRRFPVVPGGIVIATRETAPADYLYGFFPY
jgi:hypothetical protein